MSEITTFQQYLQTAFVNGVWSTDEVIEFVLPLFEEVLSFHESSTVGSFERPDTVFLTNGRLDIDENYAHAPSNNLPGLGEILKNRQIGGYQITQRLQVDDNVITSNQNVSNLEVEVDPNKQMENPVFLPGFTCYEMRVGHHDPQTDIFCLGLILGSAVMGLDLYDIQDLNRFAHYRNQPSGLNPRIHPTLSAMVTEMTELDRSMRSPDLSELIQRLKFYRDYDPQRQVDLSALAAMQVKQPADRRSFILNKLKNRLFDTSRRNRLLYYKPNSRFINLTVSSVPMVLHYQSINPKNLVVWNKDISTMVIGMKDISLNKYLRFEDHPYLSAQLNGIRHQADVDKKEYGFSQLRLAVAFLHWHNLKETPDERIQSPLLLLPIELERKKSLKEERFSMKILDNAAIINPVLANQLKDLFGIVLPESIDFDDVSMEQFFTMLQIQIDAAKQGVKLNYIDQPRIKVVHTIARQTINNYRKRMKLKGSPSFNHIDYSYSEENYKPLGLELFRQKVEPKHSQLEFLLSETPAAATQENFAETEAKGTAHLTDGENNPYSWDFDLCNIVLGNFNYKKMSLVGDYNTIAEKNIPHAVFGELFSETPRVRQNFETTNDPADWYHVVTADPTQSKAILYSRTGKSYIIQGPPGTGKSQTITNLIADFLAQGKSILFVCEKRAALDVVFHRLKQNKLSELCCYIHDSQGDKKEFIKDLKAVYENFLKEKMDLPTIRLQRKIVLERLLASLELVRDYHKTQKTTTPEIGLPTQKLLQRLVRLNVNISTLTNAESESSPHYRDWVEFGEIIKQLSIALEESGAAPEFSHHPFSNLGKPLLKAENPFLLMENLTVHAKNTIDQLQKIIAENKVSAIHSEFLESIKNLIEDSVILEPLAQSGNLELVDAKNDAAKDFERLYQEYQQLKKSYQESLQTTSHWKNKFSKQETELALAIARKYEKSFFKFLNGDWRRLKKQLKQAYDFEQHQLPPTFDTVLSQLEEEYTLETHLKQGKAGMENRYKVENIDMVYVGLDVLRRKQGDQEIDYLIAHNNSNELVLKLSKLNNAFHQLEIQLHQCLFEVGNKSLSGLKDELETIKQNSDLLRELLPYLRKFSELPEKLQSFIRKLPLTPVQAEAVMANKTLQLFYQNNPRFASTNLNLILATVRDIEEAYKRLLHLNSDLIRAERREMFLSAYALSNIPLASVPPEKKVNAKQYAEGRKILEHEMGKTMRFKSIRELASNQSGKVLRDIKPVWLMSPLSVSDSLPLDTGYFDVVIFDEASQITLEEGIPALFRAPQAIIVGDEKQMPPSNFFNARSEDPQDLETFEGEMEDEILSTEADSLLVQGARKLENTMLSWHYRSRYESLISYSNHAFYGAGLLTIPDRTLPKLQGNLLQVGQATDGDGNAVHLLKDSISFHHLPHSVYENRGNVGEANYIAQMIRRLLLDNIKESIGIVAFSQEQQGIIEEAIETLALEDKAFDEVLEKAYNRTEDGQFTGLFVKNLENVQGDERDIIIMSVCYGFDSNKKMLMNFGPINRKGGEKRLNVIFSRARKHMAVVSSIQHHHITNIHNGGANYLKLFLQYAESISTGNSGKARAILDGLVKDEKVSGFTDTNSEIVAEQVKASLEAKGYEMDLRIGQSKFKCSIAVKSKTGEGSYCLGIMIDDELHYSNDDLMEQYYQRPAILQSFGWEIAHVYTKDWMESKERVLSGLLKKLENKTESDNDMDSGVGAGLIENIPNPVTLNGPIYTSLLSGDGEKIWEVALEGSQLYIRSGKKGMKGLVQVKTFASVDDASLEKDRLMEEQIKLGFLIPLKP